jgi:hypothetical protein
VGDQLHHQESSRELPSAFVEAKGLNAEKLYFLTGEQIDRLGRLNGGSATLQPPEAWAWVKKYHEQVFEGLRDFCSGVDECRYPQCSSIHTFVSESEGRRPTSSRSIDPRHGTPLFIGGQCGSADAQYLDERALESPVAETLLAAARADLLEYLEQERER